MKTEQFTQEIEQALGDGLVSVILYGSAARGDSAAKRSNINLLVVSESLDMAVLNALLKPTRNWLKAGNPPPLLFTESRLAQSADSFPIELQDIQASYKVLLGKDVFEDFSIQTVHLRWQLEHELKGALIHLREHYLSTDGRPKLVLELMIGALGTLTTLMRATLRCLGETAPELNKDAITTLAKLMEFDSKPYLEVLRAKHEGYKPVDVTALFSTYLSSTEKLVDAVDKIKESK